MLATAQDYAALIHMANFPSRANWYVKIAVRPRSPAAKQGGGPIESGDVEQHHCDL